MLGTEWVEKGRGTSVKNLINVMLIMQKVTKSNAVKKKCEKGVLYLKQFDPNQRTNIDTTGGAFGIYDLDRMVAVEVEK